LARTGRTEGGFCGLGVGELSGWVFSLVKMPIEHNGRYAQYIRYQKPDF
jgi:hypothetical protein